VVALVRNPAKAKDLVDLSASSRSSANFDTATALDRR
jgi:hypothetical protein